MEKLLIKAEGRGESGVPDLESLAARLDSIVAGLAQGTITSATPAGAIRETLTAAAGALRRLRPSTPTGAERELPLFS